MLSTSHASAGFESGAGGVQLRELRHESSDQEMRLARDEPVRLVLLTTAQARDPDLSIPWLDRRDLSFQGVADDGKRLTLRYRHALADVEVACELDSETAGLRKTVTCAARDEPVYVAAVALWSLRLADLWLAYPDGHDPQLQPVVWFGARAGALATLQWPRTYFQRTGAEGFELSRRPAAVIEPGQSLTVATGSLLLFPLNAAEAKLDTARRIFFDHVASLHRPRTALPRKFTTWGPWLGLVDEARCRSVLDDLHKLGVELFHVDAGWQDPDHPPSVMVNRFRDADDAGFDRAVCQRDCFPDGLRPLRRELEKRGMGLSLWFDTRASVFLTESETGAARDGAGRVIREGTWLGHAPSVPVQSLAGPYGHDLALFIEQMQRRYRLAGLMFDNATFVTDFAPGRRGLACGWDSYDVQLNTALSIFADAACRNPDLYRFYCHGDSPWPWMAPFVTHLHAGDPGHSPLMAQVARSDYPLRALAFERRAAWRAMYDRFVPPWLVKGDIAGWSVQQWSPIPINRDDGGELPGFGEGWTAAMFTCLATTPVRDIRFDFTRMPDFDKRVLKRWLDWDRRRCALTRHARPLSPASTDPNAGVQVISQLRDGQGVLYLFNQSFDTVNHRLRLKGTRSRATMVYPVVAPLDHGDEITVPLIGKDCAVIEVGLDDSPAPTHSLEQYRLIAASVVRSFTTRWLTPAAELFPRLAQRGYTVETGRSASDQLLATQLLPTLAAAVGRPQDRDGTHRLVIGTHDGLADHPVLGSLFVEELDARLIRLDHKLFSAPLVVEHHGVIFLGGPRPDHLARIDHDLTAWLLAQRPVVTPPLDGTQAARQSPPSFSLRLAVPHGQPLLRFKPFVRVMSNQHLPPGLGKVRLSIRVGETVLWQWRVPPFHLMHRRVWWPDKVASLADYAGREVTLDFRAEHVDGPGHELLAIGFDPAIEARSLP